MDKQFVFILSFWLDLHGCGRSNEKGQSQYHYSWKHAAKPDELRGQKHLDEVEAPRQSIRAPDKQLPQDQCLTDGSAGIAQELRPRSVEPVRECLVAAVELLQPDKVKLFQSYDSSSRGVAGQITDMAQDVELPVMEPHTTNKLPTHHFLPNGSSSSNRICVQ